MREMRCRTCFLSGIVLFVLLSFPILSCVGASSQMWSQTYGGAEDDTVYALVKTSDGGYALAGSTKSFFVGNEFFWLVKTDKYGTVQWNQSYGKSISDTAYALVETSDGGLALAGGVWPSVGVADFWLVKTDADGDMKWNQTYGGASDDRAYALVESSDGGYVLAGSTESFGAGKADLWLIKTDEYGNIPEFPSWAILPLLLAATLLALFFKKRLSFSPSSV
jgi:hypothetical protein